MAEQNSETDAYRQYVLNGRTPSVYLQEELKRFGNALQRSLNVSEKAYLVYGWMARGIVTLDEVSTAVDKIGLTAQEAATFISETIPAIEQMLKEEEHQRILKDREAQKQFSERFVSQWGVERIDGIVQYFQQHQDTLTKIDPFWEDVLQQYPERKEKLEKKLNETDDPIEKSKLLFRELYRITLLHPSELNHIFSREEETESFIYLDTLLAAEPMLFETNMGKDPDFDNIHMSAGGIGLTVSIYSIDDPDSIKRHAREQGLGRMIFLGARLPHIELSDGDYSEPLDNSQIEGPKFS